jgi:hypothetical protein
MMNKGLFFSWLNSLLKVRENVVHDGESEDENEEDGTLF